MQEKITTFQQTKHVGLKKHSNFTEKLNMVPDQF